MALDLNFKPFSGVGIVSLYRRNPATGLPSGGGMDLGETVKLDITNSAPKLEMNTSRSPDRGVAFSMAQNKSGNVTMTLKTVSDPVWALLTSGSWTESAGAAAVQGWTAPTGLAVGELLKLPHQNVSSVVIKDSTGAPVTLQAGVHYQAGADADMAGTYKLLSLQGITQPLKVDYTPGAVKVLGGLKAPDEDWIVFFNGTNAYNNERHLMEIFKFRFSPDGAISMISDGGQYPEFSISGSMQKDETKAVGSAGGQYYKMVSPVGV